MGNSTSDPAGTTRMCGSKLLFFCTSRRFGAESLLGYMDELGVPAASPADRRHWRGDWRQPHDRRREWLACRVVACDLDAAMTRRGPRAGRASADACVAAVRRQLHAQCAPALTPSRTRVPATFSHGSSSIINRRFARPPIASLKKELPSSDSDDQHCSLRRSSEYVVRCRYSAENNRSDRGR